MSAPWITNLSATKRACTLFGRIRCVAAFDISEESLTPYLGQILRALSEDPNGGPGPEIALHKGLCDAVDLGVYGPGDVRAWRVFFT